MTDDNTTNNKRRQICRLQYKTSHHYYTGPVTHIRCLSILFRPSRQTVRICYQPGAAGAAGRQSRRVRLGSEVTPAAARGRRLSVRPTARLTPGG